VSKRFLPVEFVASAREWANTLVRRESRGPGDMENAMRRLEARYGIPWRVFWSFRYRPPTDVLTGTFFRLKAAYEQECERQMRLLNHELEITKAKAGTSAPAIRAAEALVAEDKDF
jgi:hypothetical protein